MELAARVLFSVAAVGTLTSTIYSAMVIVGAIRFGLLKRREDSAPAGFLPPVSVLKPLHGTEPDLEENLHRFFQLDYPEFELLFCARQETDAGLRLARRIALGYPMVSRALSYLRRAPVSKRQGLVADVSRRRCYV